uniref:Uncharacterized protein n=1 Tax=Macaca fascicularis TaxID=9541 RepID=A0A7N9CL98_MACFA
WRLHLGFLLESKYFVCLFVCFCHKNCSKIHVQDVQVCYIGKHVPWWFAAPINPSLSYNSVFVTV